jgi:hypothetical protein
MKQACVLPWVQSIIATETKVRLRQEPWDRNHRTAPEARQHVIVLEESCTKAKHPSKYQWWFSWIRNFSCPKMMVRWFQAELRIVRILKERTNHSFCLNTEVRFSENVAYISQWFKRCLKFSRISWRSWRWWPYPFCVQQMPVSFVVQIRGLVESWSDVFLKFRSCWETTNSVVCSILWKVTQTIVARSLKNLIFCSCLNCYQRTENIIQFYLAEDNHF